MNRPPYEVEQVEGGPLRWRVATDFNIDAETVVAYCFSREDAERTAAALNAAENRFATRKEAFREH